MSQLVVCRSASVVAVAVGIAVSGAGLNASVIFDDALLFPLRLGFACAIPVPLASVFIVNVSGYVGGSLSVYYPVAATAAVNVRNAACPDSSPRRLAALVAGHTDAQAASLRSPWVQHRRVADVSSTIISVNGTYVVVGLRIDVVVPAAVIAAAGGNLLSISAVSGVVTSVNAIMPGAGNSSASFGAAVGAFLTAAATAVGTNASALTAGSAGAPSLAIATAAGSTSVAASASSSGGGGLSAGAIAGIVVSLLLFLLVCVVLLCCFITKSRRQERKAMAVPLPDAAGADALPGDSRAPLAQKVPSSVTNGGGDTLPVISNPMLALREQRSTSTAVGGAAGVDEQSRKGRGDSLPNVGALPSYTNPLSTALEQRAQPRAAATLSDVRGPPPRDSNAGTDATSM